MTLEEILKQNQGVILGKRPADFVGGTIPYEVRVQNGDWRSFKPTGEKQYRPPVDFMACVTFSALNSCEFQNIQQGNQEINFSDRFTAKDSGTTHQGNWLYKVADSIRAGMVLESDYPTPDNITWDAYYQTIPTDIYAKRKVYDVAYEWINKKDLSYHLKHAPIQIIITNTNPNHAVLAVYKDGDTVYYFDSYEPFIKTININDVYPDALKIVGNSKMTNSLIVKNGEEYGIYDPATSEDGLITLMRNRGIPVPLKADGKLDFAKITVTKKIVDV